MLKSVFTVDVGGIEIGGAIRCTIGVLVPIVVGIAAGAVADGVAAAVGALSVGFVSFQGGYRSRASLTVLVAAPPPARRLQERAAGSLPGRWNLKRP